jgi:peptide methionine sulfoxide reductase MsrA
VHAVNGHRIQPPFPEGMQTAVFGAGCLRGVEKVFWETRGIYSTAVGYAGGYTPTRRTRRPATGRSPAEIAELGQCFYAEGYHQQYLCKVPNGYCPVHSTGVSCPVGLPGV